MIGHTTPALLLVPATLPEIRPLRVSVTSGQWHEVQREVTRAGGREQPPAEDPHVPSSSQRSHQPQKIIHTKLHSQILPSPSLETLIF